VGLVVAAALAAAGCFTSPINMAPTVQIDPPASVPRHGTASFSATTSDPNGGRPRLWWKTTSECPTDIPPPLVWQQGPWSEEDVLMLPLPGTMIEAPLCVWAQAVDDEGAASVTWLPVNPIDLPPEAHIALTSPAEATSFPLHTMFVLTPDGTTDPDDTLDTLTFSWNVEPGPLAPAAASMSGPMPAAGLECMSCPPDAGPHAECCVANAPGLYDVELQVTDPANKTAVASRSLWVLPGDPPVAAIDIVSPTGAGPFPLEAPVRFSGASSTGDPVDFMWHVFLELPSGPQEVPLSDCDGDTSKMSQCFVPNVDGNYRVTLQVTNDSGATSPTVTVPFTVAPDQPPCLEHETPSPPVTTVMTMTDPATMTNTKVITFVADKVSDDLDASNLTYEWFESDDGMTFRFVSSVSSSLKLTPSISFGDVFVRLQISDRNTDRSAQEFAACHTDVCSLPSLIHPDTCIQRVTWKVHVLP
jgi:hypothetical protein